MKRAAAILVLFLIVVLVAPAAFGQEAGGKTIAGHAGLLGAAPGVPVAGVTPLAKTPGRKEEAQQAQ